MTVHPLPVGPLPATAPARPLPRRRARLRAARRLLLRLAALAFAFALLRADGWSYSALVRLEVRAATAGHTFDLLTWELDALAQKARTLVAPPSPRPAQEEHDLVVGYLERAADLRRVEEEIARLDAEGADHDAPLRAELLGTLATLRAEQAQARPVAEAILQRQIGEVLAEAGFGVAGRVMPPVLFTFSESPRKLVLSPRARITTAQSRMIDDAIPPDEVERIEAELEAGDDYSAYIARTGGMGAFPTMVVDDASLPWVLSTVAHEWVHTYLTFFPLGVNYGISQENVTINETAADLVGNEIGRRALMRFYPELLPPLLRETPPELIGADDARSAESAAIFDFNKEMAETRAVADQLLAAGRIEDAEAYMEVRRLLFVENGYHLRTLNQAWFAFHGSYGSGPAADIETPDAIAPRVQALYERAGDPRTFLHAIRGITDAAGLERL